MQQYAPIILTSISLILLGLICFQNLNPVNLVLLGSKSSMPLAIPMFGTFLLGLLPAIGFKLVRQKKETVAKTKEVEWEKQDEKLAKEIGSDKVKQLEAKIETLETALKAAITKKK